MLEKTLKKFILGALLFILIVSSAFFFWGSRPMVSVVIPVHNREVLLPRALDSLLNQTYQDFEIIVVDDASTDKTPEILKNYQKISNKIRVITHKENKGVSHARNTGNSHAKGKYIALVDSDDYAKPQFLEIAVEFMETHPSVTLGVPVKHGYYEKESPNVLNPKTFSWHYPVHGFVVGNRLGNVGNIFKRSFIKKHNIQYNPEYSCAEDYDFWLQMILKGATVAKIRTGDPLVVFRAYGGLSVVGNCHFANKKIKENFSKVIDYDLNNKKFDYCQALQAVKKVFPNVFLKEDDIQTVCPKPTDTYIKLIHKGWSDYLIFSKDISLAYRKEVKDYAQVLLFMPYKKIVLKWDYWGEETFVFDEKENGYVAQEKNKK